MPSILIPDTQRRAHASVVGAFCSGGFDEDDDRLDGEEDWDDDRLDEEEDWDDTRNDTLDLGSTVSPRKS
ncbi:MAG: hypothetical protein QM775_30920 [Pirellulales bacterium]